MKNAIIILPWPWRRIVFKVNINLRVHVFSKAMYMQEQIKKIQSRDSLQMLYNVHAAINL